ncbi:glycosyltransferase [Syntrophomonas wolfei]|uniref:glycosyltransferase n=1 Tax=Syntrophomonas wolfei TaxID=863 RepID=UPI0023F57009|nr:glycosyltransferase [Syntrophomonas wolfei]
MKLLVISGDFRQYLDSSFHSLMTALADLLELYLWHESGSIKDILPLLPSTPDFVLLNEPGEINSPVIDELSSLSIPYAVYLHDLHHDSCKEALQDKKLCWVFTRYRDRFRDWYPEWQNRMSWLPHHIDSNIFKDYHLPKTIDYLMMGALHEYIYSLRYKIREKMTEKPGFVYHEHPGYKHFSPAEMKKLLVGPNYAREINRARLFLSCDSVYKYPLLKYFEVLACNTLLLAPSSPELLDLGFVPGVHFVEIDELNFEEKAEYYLKHEKERKEIARQGYEMVREKHSSTRRAAQLLEMIEGILESYSSFPHSRPWLRTI